MVRKFVHPGYISSQNDSQEHFIPFYKLCELYMLNPNDPDVINAQYGTEGRGFKKNDSDQHFYPRYDGKYPIFDNDVEPER